MTQLQLIATRLKNPSVLISIASQIVTILVLFNIHVDYNMITGVIAAISSIFVALGIISNPDTKAKGYGDDIALCPHCNKETQHVMVGGAMICSECGGSPSAADNTASK